MPTLLIGLDGRDVIEKIRPADAAEPKKWGHPGLALGENLMQKKWGYPGLMHTRLLKKKAPECPHFFLADRGVEEDGCPGGDLTQTIIQPASSTGARRSVHGVQCTTTKLWTAKPVVRIALPSFSRTNKVCQPGCFLRRRYSAVAPRPRRRA